MSERRTTRDRLIATGVGTSIFLGAIAGAGVLTEKSNASHEAGIARETAEQHGLNLVDRFPSSLPEALGYMAAAQSSASAIPDSGIARRVQNALDAKAALVAANAGLEVDTTPGSETANTNVASDAALLMGDIGNIGFQKRAEAGYATNVAYTLGNNYNPDGSPAVTGDLLRGVQVLNGSEYPDQSPELYGPALRAIQGDQMAKNELNVQQKEVEADLGGFVAQTYSDL